MIQCQYVLNQLIIKIDSKIIYKFFMKTIDQHIQKDKSILEDPLISAQLRRHTEEELVALEAYKEHHPEDSHDPTALELYCDSHPESLECRIYED